MDELTQKEQEIYNYVVNYGLSNTSLAEKCNVSVRTIETHLTNILSKLKVSTQKELIIKHYKEQIKDSEDAQNV